MGEVIRRTASADDIFADVRATLVNARAKGGIWKALAEGQLADVVVLIDGVEVRVAATGKELDPLAATLDAKNDESDRLLGRVSDEIWNEVGRPAADPALSILFPGGIAYYADGSTETQPDRMDLLAELLESNIHPRLSPAQAKAHAKEVRASSKTLRAAVEAARVPAARADLLQRVRRAVAMTAQVELAGLKRMYKIEHFSEADIHAVIPDRPNVPRKGAPPVTPPPPAPTPAPAG
jgi:hypothetical protein